MTIHIYVDPPYMESLWCKQTLRGINDEATKKRYSVKMLDTDNIYTADLDSFFEDEGKRILIVLATSVIKSERFNSFFNKNGVHLLYINHQSTDISYRFSNIIVDYREAMRTITSYLEGCGRERIALYGINPDSSTDLIKKTFFEERAKRVSPHGCANNIYIRHVDDKNSTTIDCFDSLYSNVKMYDSVICANDLVARLLISDLEKSGVRVPEDLYVVSFGDYILAQIGKPSITSISIDHEELGRQSVYTYSYLRKAAEDVYITASIATKLSIGESTAMSQFEFFCSEHTYDKEELTTDFFKHPEIQAVITFENMLTKCDKLDMQILIGIMNGMTYNQLSDKLYVSENVISYRVKRLCKLANITSKGKLAQAANKLLSADAIEKYIIKKLT